MEQKQEEQNCDFTNEQREILKETFKFVHFDNKCEEKSLEDIIDSAVDVIKNDCDYKNCIKKYWFTKQIEKWKENNNTDKDPEDGELMNIVKKDLKIRIANTMLALEKRKDIDKNYIRFYQNDYDSVFLRHNDDEICKVSDFKYSTLHASPPYKPFS